MCGASSLLENTSDNHHLPCSSRSGIIASSLITLSRNIDGKFEDVVRRPDAGLDIISISRWKVLPSGLSSHSHNRSQSASILAWRRRSLTLSFIGYVVGRGRPPVPLDRCPSSQK